MKKFDLVNPVIGKLATQVKASKLTDYQLTKKLLQQGKIDELQCLYVSPYNTRAQNSAIIARKNNEKFVNRKIRARTREIANIPKGIVNKIKSTTNFNLPDTPPQMPEEDYWLSVELLSVPPLSRVAPFPPAPPLFNYEKDFPPLLR